MIKRATVDPSLLKVGNNDQQALEKEQTHKTLKLLRNKHP